MDLEKMASGTTRVHSVVTIKAIDDEAREFVGLASTPATDRMDDIVEPSGAEYKLPLALLWQHDRMLPVDGQGYQGGYRGSRQHSQG